MLSGSGFPVSSILVLALWASGAAADERDCRCVEARAGHGWCAACGVGYIAGVEIRSETLWEALDAHGHAIDDVSRGCEACRAAIRDSGFCQTHGRGYVGGEAYLSRLTYHVAKGMTQDVATIECPACRESARSTGWCEEHGAGWIGNVRIDREADYASAVRAYGLLLRAIEMLDTCELCAASLAANGTCPVHRIRYRDGERVSTDGH